MKRSRSRLLLSFAGLTPFIFGAALTISIALAAERSASNPLPATGAEIAQSLAICRDAGVTAEQVANWRACWGYLAGIINGASATASLLGQPQIFCIPEDTTDAALRDALIEHFSTSPAAAASPAAGAVIDALITTHPCE